MSGNPQGVWRPRLGWPGSINLPCSPFWAVDLRSAFYNVTQLNRGQQWQWHTQSMSTPAPSVPSAKHGPFLFYVGGWFLKDCFVCSVPTPCTTPSLEPYWGKTISALATRRNNGLRANDTILNLKDGQSRPFPLGISPPVTVLESLALILCRRVTLSCTI